MPRSPRDNANVIDLQGFAGTLSDCTVCHGHIPQGPGPHPAPVGVGDAPEGILSVGDRLQIGPNPFLAQARIQIPAGPGPDGRLLVFDVQGRTLALFKPQRSADGNLWMEWNGQGRGGKRVSPGTYYLRWENGVRSASGKAMVLD